MDILFFLSKKRPINFGKEKGVCPRVYYTTDSAFEAIAIYVHIIRMVMLCSPLRKIQRHFAAPVVTEGMSLDEAACCDGFKPCQLAGKWFTSPSMSQESNVRTAALSDRSKLGLPIHAVHILNRLNAMPWSYHAT